MNFPFFVAKRFFKSIGRNSRQASNPTITVATAGVALGLTVMLITVSVIMGFKQEITKKIEGFGGHVQIMDKLSISNPDAYPIATDSQFVDAIRRLPQVKSVGRVSSKMGVIKTYDDFLSITFRGLSAHADTAFLHSALVQGRLPKFDDAASNEIILSQRQANELRLKVGDRVFAYFFEETIKTRRLTVVGIYRSNMAIFDQNYVFAPIATIDKLNGWDNEKSTYLDVRLHSMEDLSQAMQQIGHVCGRMNMNELDKARLPISVTELYAQVFGWLSLLDFNMIVILVLMVAVSGFTMVSGLFILILERTQTIGVFKTMGASNATVRKIFLNFAALITLRGLVIGNVLALVLLGIQHQFHFVHLDPATYYVDTVPVEFPWLAFIIINVITLALTVLALVGPSYMITRIQPAKAIKFE